MEYKYRTASAFKCLTNIDLSLGGAERQEESYILSSSGNVEIDIAVDSSKFYDNNYKQLLIRGNKIQLIFSALPNDTLKVVSLAGNSILIDSNKTIDVNIINTVKNYNDIFLNLKVDDEDFENISFQCTIINDATRSKISLMGVDPTKMGEMIKEECDWMSIKNGIIILYGVSFSNKKNKTYYLAGKIAFFVKGNY